VPGGGKRFAPSAETRRERFLQQLLGAATQERLTAALIVGPSLARWTGCQMTVDLGALVWLEQAVNVRRQTFSDSATLAHVVDGTETFPG
jgi:hypothetical protein